MLTDGVSTYGPIAFAMSYSLLAMSPGPNFLVVAEAGLNNSRGQALWAALGVAIGASTLAAFISMWSTFSEAAEQVKTLIALFFCGLLLFIGCRQFLSAIYGRLPDISLQTFRNQRHFWAGLATAICNPVSAGFFTVQLEAANRGVDIPASLIAITVFLIAIAWFTMVALTITTQQARTLYYRWRRPVSAVTGLLLIYAAFACLHNIIH